MGVDVGAGVGVDVGAGVGVDVGGDVDVGASVGDSVGDWIAVSRMGGDGDGSRMSLITCRPNKIIAPRIKRATVITIALERSSPPSKPVIMKPFRYG